MSFTPPPVGPLPIIQLAGIVLPTYQVFMSMMLSFLAIYVFLRADKKGVSGTTALDLFIVVVLSGAIGARLFHVIYEEPHFYMQSPVQIFFFWQGGFVYYGGFLCGLIAGYVTLRLKRESFILWCDFFAPVASIAYAVGRIACFLEGCCYGKVCELPWAYGGRHPTQLYAVGIELCIYLGLLHLEKIKAFAARPGGIFMTWVLLHGLERLFIEFFRDDDRGSFIAGMSVSTLISLGLVLSAGIYFFKRPK